MNRSYDLVRQLGRGKTWAAMVAVAMSAQAIPDAARATVLEAPSGTISTVSGGPNFTYDMTLKNASNATVPIGTFWFAWVPGEDFLATSPLSETAPNGWRVNAITHFGSTDGYAIQWVANSAASDVPIGGSLSGFNFTTTDSPASVNGDSPFFPGTPVLTSFVYDGAPFSDAGTEFAPTPVPEPASLAVGLVPMAMLLRRRRRTVR
jgi:hypothetical protein